MAHRCVLFVHGIGPQAAGYSAGLWDALWHHEDPAGSRCYELFYYDIFDTMNAKTAIAGIVERYGVDRLIQVLVRNSALAARMTGQLQVTLRDTVAHVLYYTLFDAPRAAITHKFRVGLVDILDEARECGFDPPDIELTIVAHSLGTAVAYAGLHDIVSDPALGLQNHVRAHNLFTLASPLELIRSTTSAAGVHVPHVTAGICRPTLQDPVTGLARSNIRAWHTYRHRHDPVASLVPLPEDLFAGALDVSVAFGEPGDRDVHGFGNYLARARGDIIGHILDYA